MSTFVFPIFANFGTGKTGLGTSVGYQVVSASGTVEIARTTSGITERQDVNSAATGCYEAAPTLNTAWGYVRVIWDITGGAGLISEQVINTGDVFMDSSIATVSTNVIALQSSVAGEQAWVTRTAGGL